jgi:single-strand DNA-binding protein
MGDVNSVVLTGRLAYDAELKRKGGDVLLCEFTLANNYSKKTGETWSKKANFFKLAIFGKTAESLFPYLKQGALVGVEAELRQNQWEKDGKKLSSNEIIVKDVRLLSPPKKRTTDKTDTEYPPEEESFPLDIF